jgi:LPXTG-motif cell wall-anchored protein
MENGNTDSNQGWLWLGAGLVLGIGLLALWKRSNAQSEDGALDTLSDVCDALSHSLEKKISMNSRLAS